MSMSRSRLNFLIAGLALAAVLAITIRARAEQLFTGHFTLPFEAHWGTVDLQPGTYSFTVENEFGSVKRVIHIYNGTKSVAMVLPEQFSDHDTDQIHQMELLVIRNSGTYNVRAMTMPNIGILYYPVPGNKNVQITKGPELIERVPVELAAK